MIRRKILSVFSLTMMTAVSVDSIRNLPATALFGSSLIFFFVLGACLFLLPSALVASELASTSMEPGGVYVWVRNAFGRPLGFLAIWFQWIENVIWYPTILAFIGGTAGFLISPQLANDKVFLVIVILAAFWIITLINWYGLHFSAWFSNFCTVAGLLLPMACIIFLGAFWLWSGHASNIVLNKATVFPSFNDASIWVSLTAIMLSFCGMEIATVHGYNVKTPQRDYPRAMLMATLIIVTTLLFGSLAIAVVLPAKDINLVAGIMQAFQKFLAAYHALWVLPILGIMLVLGGAGGLNNWVVAPTRGLAYALREVLPAHRWTQDTPRGVPGALLIFQACLASILSLVFLLMPSVNGSYWLLTALTSQLYMLMYLLMFAAAIRLRYKKIPRQKGFLIPGGYKGVWVISGLGLLGSLITLLIGFIPPTNLNIGTVGRYEGLLIVGLVIMFVPPLLLLGILRSKRNKKIIS